MTKYSKTIRAALLLAGTAAATPMAGPSAAKPVIIRGTSTASVAVYATGLNSPRELKFGPDGKLYVAEGGTGGANSTIGQCPQVLPPVGPYTGSPTGGRISKIDSDGTRHTVIDTLPSSQTSPMQGSLVSGVADVAFIGNTLYALTAGAGCSHGVPSVGNAVYRISNGHATMVANLSRWEMAHPIAHPDPNDFEPDGTWYSMVAVGGALYAVEPNQGQIDRITTSGAISRLIDTSTIADLQPTAIAYHGTFYFGNLGPFPIDVGGEKIRRLTPSGSLQTVASGLTTILGVAFDNRDRMYVLENTNHSGFPAPGMGDIVRIDPNGHKSMVVGGLDLPTGMTMGPDGALYVSVWGFGAPLGAGQVLRVSGL